MTLASEIYAALHMPQFDGQQLPSGTSVKEMYLRRIEAIIWRYGAGNRGAFEYADILAECADRLLTASLGDEDKRTRELDKAIAEYRKWRRINRPKDEKRPLSHEQQEMIVGAISDCQAAGALTADDVRRILSKFLNPQPVAHPPAPGSQTEGKQGRGK